MSDNETTEPAHVRQARYLGADAAMAAASWIELSESDALSILDDVDPAVLDSYREPNLSGEYADDPTPVSIAREVGANDGDIAFYGAIREAVERLRPGWSHTFGCDRLREVGTARPLTAETEAAYRACESEASVAYRRQARALVRAS